MSEKSPSKYISNVHRSSNSIIYREFKVKSISDIETDKRIGTDDDYLWFKLALLMKLGNNNRKC